MKKQSIYSDAALDTLFEALVKKFGSHDTWELVHYPSRKNKKPLLDFCEQYHKLVGNKSKLATKSIINFAMLESPAKKTRLHIAARYFAVKNGFIKI